MKIEKLEIKHFNPVIVTFESQEEIDIIHTILGRVMGAGKMRVISDKLYDLLESKGADSTKYNRFISRSLEIKED